MYAENVKAEYIQSWKQTIFIVNFIIARVGKPKVVLWSFQ